MGLVVWSKAASIDFHVPPSLYLESSRCIHSTHLDLGHGLSINSLLLCLIPQLILIENSEESIQEQFESDSKGMACWGHSCDGQSSAWEEAHVLSNTWDS